MIGRRRPEPSAVQRAAGLLASADLLVRQAQELLEEEEPAPARRRLRAVRPVPEGDAAAESVAESVAESDGDDVPRPRPAWLPWAGVAASTVVVAWGLTLLAPSVPLVLPGQWWVLAGVAVLVLAFIALMPRRLGGLAPLALWAAVSASPWGTAQPWSPWAYAALAAAGLALTVIPTTPTDHYDDEDDACRSSSG